MRKWVKQCNENTFLHARITVFSGSVRRKWFSWHCFTYFSKTTEPQQVIFSGKLSTIIILKLCKFNVNLWTLCFFVPQKVHRPFKGVEKKKKIKSQNCKALLTLGSPCAINLVLTMSMGWQTTVDKLPAKPPHMKWKKGFPRPVVRSLDRKGWPAAVKYSNVVNWRKKMRTVITRMLLHVILLTRILGLLIL